MSHLTWLSLCRSRQVSAYFQEKHFFLLCALCQALYDGKWHQLKLLVRPLMVTGFLDDREIRQVPLEPAQPIYINGKTQLAKRVRSDSSVPVNWRTSSTETSVSSLLQWLLTLSIVPALRLSFLSFQQPFRWSFRSCVSTATLIRARERRHVRSTPW